jgi:hypothetical protein
MERIMKKYLVVYTFALVFLYSFLGTAQNLESQTDLLVRSTENMYSAVDMDDNYVVAFQTKSQYECVFYNALHKQIGNAVFAIPSTQKKDTYLGIELNADTCSIYTLNTRSNQITQLNIGRAGGALNKKIIGQIAITEKFLKCVTLNGTYHILTATQNKNQLDVYTIKEHALVKNTYQIEMPDFYKRLSSGNHLLNEDRTAVVGIDAINYDIENNVKSARATKKIYCFDNNIFLIFDDANFTHVVKINLDINEASYKQFSYSLDFGNTSFKKQGNSFLHQKTLFRVTMSMEQMSLIAVDIETNQSYATYYATPHMPMDFKNGPLIQENSSDKVRIIEDNATFFKKVLAGNLSIAVNLKDSSYIVEIGSFEEMVTNNNYANQSSGQPRISIGMGMGGGMGGGMGMGGMGMGMGGMGMGMGGMGMGGGMGGMGMGGYGMGGGYGASPYNYGSDSPGYYNGYNGYYPYNSTATSIRTVYVHCMLDSSTYKHQAGIVPITLRERVSNFETETFKTTRPELIRVIDFKNRIIIGYIIPNTKEFKQYSFYK